MWVRSEFGVLVNLQQAGEVTLVQGTVEAHIGGQTRPLAHRANEVEARKVFELVAQYLSEGKTYLDLSLRPHESPGGTVSAASPGEVGASGAGSNSAPGGSLPAFALDDKDKAL